MEVSIGVALHALIAALISPLEISDSLHVFLCARVCNATLASSKCIQVNTTKLQASTPGAQDSMREAHGAAGKVSPGGNLVPTPLTSPGTGLEATGLEESEMR